MDIFNYKQARAFAAVYGTWVGIMWIGSFACYILGLSNPLLANFSFILGLLSIIAAIVQMRRFHRNIAPLSLGRAYWMALLIYSYSTLLMALGQYIYFRYLDNGFLASAYEAVINNPQYQELLQSMMPGQDYKTTTNEAINLLRNSSAGTLTIQLMVYNMLLGFILALPTGLIGKSGKSFVSNSENK